MAQKIDAKFKGNLTCASKNDMKNLANFTSLAEKWKFILEGKIAKLIKIINQKLIKNSKQPDRPGAV